MTSSETGHAGTNGKDLLIELLWRIGAFQFGEFSEGNTSKSSPIFINTKQIISSPNTLRTAGELVAAELEILQTRRRQNLSDYHFLAGIPLGGLHLATALSLQIGKPLLYIRPPRIPSDLAEPPHLEGTYRPGQQALVVDDLATGGTSLRETTITLRSLGITVSDAIVLIDREEGATKKLEEFGVRVHALITMSYLARRLIENEHISQETYELIQAYSSMQKDKTL